MSRVSCAYVIYHVFVICFSAIRHVSCHVSCIMYHVSCVMYHVMCSYVSGMIPKNKHKEPRLSRLLIYAGPHHPHTAQFKVNLPPQPDELQNHLINMPHQELNDEIKEQIFDEMTEQKRQYARDLLEGKRKLTWKQVPRVPNRMEPINPRKRVGPGTLPK